GGLPRAVDPLERDGHRITALLLRAGAGALGAGGAGRGRLAAGTPAAVVTGARAGRLGLGLGVGGSPVVGGLRLLPRLAGAVALRSLLPHLDHRGTVVVQAQLPGAAAKALH